MQRHLPNDTASRSEETLGPVGVLLDGAQQIEDGVNVGAEEVLLVARVHRDDSAIPRIKDTFPQRGDVIDHLVVVLGGQIDLASLLEYLSNDGQVGFESTVNGVGDVAEALQNSGLELIAKCGALLRKLIRFKRCCLQSITYAKVVKQRVHEGIAVRLDLLAK